MNSFVRFLEEFTTWQFAFEINWRLVSVYWIFSYPQSFFPVFCQFSVWFIIFHDFLYELEHRFIITYNVLIMINKYFFLIISRIWIVRRKKKLEWTVTYRALPDITSGPEVRQNFKIRTVRKPDVFLPERQTFNTFKKRKKKRKNDQFPDSLDFEILPDFRTVRDVR